MDPTRNWTIYTADEPGTATATLMEAFRKVMYQNILLIPGPNGQTLPNDTMMSSEERLRRGVQKIKQHHQVTTAQELWELSRAAPPGAGGADKMAFITRSGISRLNTQLSEWKELSDNIYSSVPIAPARLAYLSSIYSTPPWCTLNAAGVPTLINYNTLPPAVQTEIRDRKRFVEVFHNTAMTFIELEPSQGFATFRDRAVIGNNVTTVNRTPVSDKNHEAVARDERSYEQTRAGGGPGYRAPGSESTTLDGDVPQLSNGRYNLGALVGMRVFNPSSNEVNLGLEKPVLLVVNKTTGQIQDFLEIDNAPPIAPTLPDQDQRVVNLSNHYNIHDSTSNYTFQWGRSLEQVEDAKTRASMKAKAEYRYGWATRTPKEDPRLTNLEHQNNIYADLLRLAAPYSTPGVPTSLSVEYGTSYSLGYGSASSYVLEVLNNGFKDRVLAKLVGVDIQGGRAGKVDSIMIQDHNLREVANKLIRNEIALESVIQRTNSGVLPLSPIGARIAAGLSITDKESYSKVLNVLNDYVDTHCPRGADPRSVLNANIAALATESERYVTTSGGPSLGSVADQQDLVKYLIEAMAFVNVNIGQNGGTGGATFRVDERLDSGGIHTVKGEHVDTPASVFYKSAMNLTRLDSIVRNDADGIVKKFGYFSNSSRPARLGLNPNPTVYNDIPDNVWYLAAARRAVLTDPAFTKYLSMSERRRFLNNPIWYRNFVLNTPGDTRPITAEDLVKIFRSGRSRYYHNLEMAMGQGVAQHSVLRDGFLGWKSDPLLFRKIMGAELFLNITHITNGYQFPIFNILSPTSWLQAPYALAAVGWQATQSIIPALEYAPVIGRKSVFLSRWKELLPKGPDLFAQYNILAQAPAYVTKHFQTSLFNYVKYASHLWVRTSEGKYLFNPFFGYNLTSQRVLSLFERMWHHEMLDRGIRLANFRNGLGPDPFAGQRLGFFALFKKNLITLLSSRQDPLKRGIGNNLIWEFTKIFVATAFERGMRWLKDHRLLITDEATILGRGVKFGRYFTSSIKDFGTAFLKGANLLEGYGAQHLWINENLTALQRVGVALGKSLHILRGVEVFTFEGIKSFGTAGFRGILADFALRNNPLNFNSGLKIPFIDLTIPITLVSPIAVTYFWASFAHEFTKGLAKNYILAGGVDASTGLRFVREAWDPARLAGPGFMPVFRRFLKSWGETFTPRLPILTRLEVQHVAEFHIQHGNRGYFPATLIDRVTPFEPTNPLHLAQLNRQELRAMMDGFYDHASHGTSFFERLRSIYTAMGNVGGAEFMSLHGVKLFHRWPEILFGQGSGTTLMGRFFLPFSNGAFRGVNSLFVYQILEGLEPFLLGLPLPSWLAAVVPSIPGAVAGSYFGYGLIKQGIPGIVEMFKSAGISRVADAVQQSDATVSQIFTKIDHAGLKGVDLLWYAMVSKEAGPWVAFWDKGVVKIWNNGSQIVKGSWDALWGKEHALDMIGLAIPGFVEGIINFSGVWFGRAAMYAGLNALGDSLLAPLFGTFFKSFGFFGILNPFAAIGTAIFIGGDLATGGLWSRWLIDRAKDLGGFVWDYLSSQFPNLQLYLLAHPGLLTAVNIGAVIFGTIGLLISGFSPWGFLLGAAVGAGLGGIVYSWHPEWFDIGGLATLPLVLGLLSFIFSFIMLFRRSELSSVVLGVVMMGLSLFPLLAAAGLNNVFPYYDYSGSTSGTGFGGFANQNIACPIQSSIAGTNSTYGCTNGTQDGLKSPSVNGSFVDDNHYYSKSEDIGGYGHLDDNIIAPIDGVVTNAWSLPCVGAMGLISLKGSDSNSDILINLYHAYPINIKVGDTVKLGQPIGKLVNCTGNWRPADPNKGESYAGGGWQGAHLHIEFVYYNSKTGKRLNSPDSSYGCPAYDSVALLSTGKSPCANLNMCEIGTTFGCNLVPANGAIVTIPKGVPSTNTTFCPLSTGLIDVIKKAAASTYTPASLLAAEIEYNNNSTGGARQFFNPNFTYINENGDKITKNNLSVDPNIQKSNGPTYLGTGKTIDYQRQGATGLFTEATKGINKSLSDSELMNVLNSNNCKPNFASSGFNWQNVSDSLFATGLILNRNARKISTNSSAAYNPCGPVNASSNSLNMKVWEDPTIIKKVSTEYVCRGSQSDYPSCGQNESTSVQSLSTYFKNNCGL